MGLKAMPLDAPGKKLGGVECPRKREENMTESSTSNGSRNSTRPEILLANYFLFLTLKLFA